MKATIVGAGIGGLVAAWRLLQLRPDARITLIDRDTRVGGLLSGGIHGEAGIYFDTGTHIPQETGVEAVDGFLQSCVPPQDLIVYTPPSGDVSGAVFAGIYQSNSHFPDLRGHPTLTATADSVRARVREHGSAQPLQRAAPLAQQLRDRFGADYADRVLLPRLSAMYGLAIEDLCAFALELPGVTRVIVDDLQTWIARAADDQAYRAIVGVPDQAELPAAFRHGRRSYYSTRHGSSAFMSGAEETLRAAGVTFRLGARLEDVDTVANRVVYSDTAGRTGLDHDVLVLSAGIMPAASMLGHDLRGLEFDRPLRHQVFHMILPEPAATACCYGYNLDDGAWYRFTNYHAFSGDPDDLRLTVEVLGEHEGEPEAIAARVRSDLFDKGLLRSGDGTLVGHVELASGFPRPSVKNFAALAGVRDAVTARLPANVMLGGVATGREVFFQNEVVMAIYNGLPEFVEKNS